MDQVLTTIETDKESESTVRGLEDGGHVIIDCSVCKKHLSDIWVTRPNEIDPKTGKVFEWNFRIECCYCGGLSYITTIQGGLHIGGYGEFTDDENLAIEKTSLGVPLPESDMPDVIRIKAYKPRKHS